MHNWPPHSLKPEAVNKTFNRLHPPHLLRISSGMSPFVSIQYSPCLVLPAKSDATSITRPRPGPPVLGEDR